MKFELNENITINISTTEVFDKIAGELNLPADWRYCFVDNGRLIRNFHEGPYLMEDVITNDNDLVNSFINLTYLYNKLKLVN